MFFNTLDHPFLTIIIITVVIIFGFPYFSSLVCSGSSSVKNTTPKTTQNIVIAAELQVTNTRSWSPTKTPRSKATIKPTTTKISTSIRDIKLVKGCVDEVSSINIRQCPGTDHKVLEYLMHGDCVELVGIEENKLWAKIKDGGWINTLYMGIDGNMNNLPVMKCELN